MDQRGIVLLRHFGTHRLLVSHCWTALDDGSPILPDGVFLDLGGISWHHDFGLDPQFSSDVSNGLSVVA